MYRDDDDRGQGHLQEYRLDVDERRQSHNFRSDRNHNPRDADRSRDFEPQASSMRHQDYSTQASSSRQDYSRHSNYLCKRNELKCSSRDAYHDLYTREDGSQSSTSTRREDRYRRDYQSQSSSRRHHDYYEDYSRQPSTSRSSYREDHPRYSDERHAFSNFDRDRRRDYRRDGVREDRDRSRPRAQEVKVETKTESRSRSPVSRKDSRDTASSSRKERVSTEELLTKEVSWTRVFPSEPFYLSTDEGVTATDRLLELHRVFQTELLGRNDRIRASWPVYQVPERRPRLKRCHNHDEDCSSSDEEDDFDNQTNQMEELERKRKHPWRLHDELWFNDHGEMNDGPVCRCSAKARKSGIRHGIYPGEEPIQACRELESNVNRLHHYRIVLTPLTNYSTKYPTCIAYDGHSYVFEGFSLLTHLPLKDCPLKVSRFNIEYDIRVVEEKPLSSYCVKDCDLITDFVFKEVLELLDIDWKGNNEGCPRVHLFPRFSRLVLDDGKELLSPAVVLDYLIKSNRPVLDQDCQDQPIRDMLVIKPGHKPCTLRVDQLDGSEIVHFGHRPPQLSYAGNPGYQKAYKDYVKFKHLLANKGKVTSEDRRLLWAKEDKLSSYRKDLRKEVTVVLNAEGFVKTGLYCDVACFALLMPVLVNHVRYSWSLSTLESTILEYKFRDRSLLQLALTHPSHVDVFGTNGDHIRNAVSNCGLRNVVFGVRKVNRKRGILMLMSIMSQLGRDKETSSNIGHNERLEFLGDAVVEFLTSVHLYFMFPDLQEGALATYRSAIVQNQHLAILAQRLELDKFMLYAHGSDLCHDSEFRHAMANCFEALLGALFLDGGLEVTDNLLSRALFNEEETCLRQVWSYRSYHHPIQRQNPQGDRHLRSFPRLEQLKALEDSLGISFTHVRLLARALTSRGYNILTLGSNQRMEFLGDTVLQLLASEYLYKFFPEHHEGHLSLLRSSLVNNKTQAVVCQDLCLNAFSDYNSLETKAKDKADLLEAFLGALFVDKGLVYCRTFCQVSFFPRLKDFIHSMQWNDPKSRLQQCCLTLRTGDTPDIPVYKVIETIGPTNTRDFRVSVKFQGQRLGVGSGHSIQEAEMNAATNALETHYFPRLERQKHFLKRKEEGREDQEETSNKK